MLAYDATMPLVHNGIILKMHQKRRNRLMIHLKVENVEATRGAAAYYYRYYQNHMKRNRNEART